MRFIIKLLTIIFGLPFLVNAQILIGSELYGELDGDNFGKQVKMAANGTILGVLSDGTNGNVHVFQNAGGNWDLYGTDSEGKHFDGIVVSGLNFSSDGNTMAIGGAGWARVYTYQSGIWIQKGSDIPNNTSNSSFGSGVCLSSDGNTIAVSAPTYVPYSGRFIPPPNYHGLVQVFEFNSGNWSQIGDDIVANAFERSAESFSLSSDGRIIAIANYFSARVYEYVSGIWTLKGNEILGIDNDRKSVSLSSDGSTLAFGDPSYSDAYIQRGRVRVFKFVSNDWLQIGSDFFGAVSYEFAGQRVSLSSDGNVVAISFNGNETDKPNSGQVKIYKNISGTWIQMGNDLNGDATNDKFGFALSLSSDASTVAIGTPFNDSNGTDAGEVKVYDLSATLASNDSGLSQFKLFPNPTSNQFAIQLPPNQELQKVTVYNNVGRLIFKTQENRIQTKTLSQGLYFVQIETNKGKATKKLVIK